MSLPAVKHVHFIGIGGYGMSALAQVLLKLGYRVSGSDLKESAITRRLSEEGATVVTTGHSRENVRGSELVVYSTAIPADNPELCEARGSGIPVWHRSELLANLINDHYGITVAGTHGKTTTTTMIALLLEQGGLDPTAIIGGTVASFEGNARLGKSRYLVAEACESDHSFLRYYPRIAVVTNMEPDHLEHYNGDFEKLREAYRTFLEHLHSDGCAVLCTDDPYLRELAPRLERRVVTYALEGAPAEAEFEGRGITFAGRTAQFVLHHHGKPVTGTIKLQVPGRHNVSNAVGALAVAAQLGLEPQQCAGAIGNFFGAGRRFEVLGEVNGITVVDDYAHHPTEVRVTLEAARAGSKRICCLFQPHRYTRTAYFFEEFARAFSDADLVLLHRIYPAGEKPVDGITAEALARRISEIKGGSVFAGENMDELENRALAFARPGDLILVMGAGDISKAAYSIYDKLNRFSD
ncbi:MAG: UDP-N-acetylmuramate--L-alanine ligase [Bacillota bacterium]